MQPQNPTPLTPSEPPITTDTAILEMPASKNTRFKKIAINIMIASLICAASIAVIAVLVGSFNDILAKALFTLLIVTLHALVSLGFLESRGKVDSANDLKLFTNTLFILIILSFITAVFGTWDLMSGDWVWKLYATYFIVAFAALHGEMLYKTLGLNRAITNIIYANYVFMVLVIILFLPVVWLGTSDATFPDFYYRLLAAVAIVDATLTILAVILSRLYLQKHPEVRSELFSQTSYVIDANGNQTSQIIESKRRIHPLLVVLGLFLLLQFIVPIIVFVIGF